MEGSKEYLASMRRHLKERRKEGKKEGKKETMEGKKEIKGKGNDKS